MPQGRLYYAPPALLALLALPLPASTHGPVPGEEGEPWKGAEAAQGLLCEQVGVVHPCHVQWLGETGMHALLPWSSGILAVQGVFVSTEAPSAAPGLQEEWWWLPRDVLRPRAVCESPEVKAHQDWLPCRAGESRTRAVTAVFHGGGVTGFVLHVCTAGEEID